MDFNVWMWRNCRWHLPEIRKRPVIRIRIDDWFGGIVIISAVPVEILAGTALMVEKEQKVIEKIAS
jgi:hypothetical protein